MNRELIIYASDLAENTKNIWKDSRACATIFSLSTEDDKQASSRLSVIGDFSKIKESGQIYKIFTKKCFLCADAWI